MASQQNRDDHAVLEMRLNLLDERMDAIEKEARTVRKWMTGNGDGPGLMEQVRLMQRSIRALLWLTSISVGITLVFAGANNADLLRGILHMLRLGVGP